MVEAEGYNGAEGSPPRNVCWEMARIKSSPAVSESSVVYSIENVNKAVITFDLRTDTLLDENSDNINDIEPIKLVYRSEKRVGQDSPSVYSDREDFPRDLPHLNPNARTEPASLCLARSGLQPIYDAVGIIGVIQRLSIWLNDAKTETLWNDGWEPLPMVSMKDCVLGYLDAADLQNYAGDHGEGGYGFLSAPIIIGDQSTVFVRNTNGIVNTSDNNEILAAKSQMAAFRKPGIPFRTAIPGIFAWPPRTKIETKPHFTHWDDMNSLVAGLKEVGLYDSLDEAFISLDPLFGDGQDSDKNGHRSILLVVGLWRPAQLDKTIVGLAQDDARHLELRAYYLVRDHNNADRWSAETEIYNFYSFVPVESEMLSEVSGEPAIKKTVFIGAGALGSAMANYAMRGGARDISVFDNDILLSHNMVRHAGLIDDVPMKKTDVLKKMAWQRSNNINVTTHEENILALDNDELAAKLGESELIIETTGDARVRRRLSRQSAPQIPIMRTELFNKGSLGVALVTHLGADQNLSCLFYQLIAKAYEDNRIAEWLKYEHSRSFLDEELLLGFGCRSKTTKLPAYKVEHHASAFFGFFKSRIENKNSAAIAINPVSDDGTPLGFEVLELDSIKVFVSDKDGSNWRVIVTSGVLEKIHELRENAAPSETGGYLYGGIDEALSEIYVVAVSDEPPGTKSSKTSLELGPAGKTDFEKAFTRRTKNRLLAIGSWHSHPVGNPEASEKDWATVKRFHVEDQRLGFPTIMFITGKSDDRAYVLVD